MDYQTWKERIFSTFIVNYKIGREKKDNNAYEIDISTASKMHFTIHYHKKLQELAENHLNDENYDVWFTYVSSKENGPNKSRITIIDKKRHLLLNVYTIIKDKSMAFTNSCYYLRFNKKGETTVASKVPDSLFSKREEKKIKEMLEAIQTFEENFGSNRLSIAVGEIKIN